MSMSEQLAKRLYAIIIMLPIALGLIFGKANSTPANDANAASQENLFEITVSDFRDKIASNDNTYILDVRTLEEFSNGHIDSAQNIDYYSPDFDSKLITLDEDKTYLIYCKNGARSSSTATKLKHLGYQKIFIMEGGIESWIKEGYDIASY